MPRAGAPRPLRLVNSGGEPLSGLPRDVAWERNGDGVLFTLERDGTRNIWRAAPDADDKSRFPAWRARPVTDLRAPRFAAQPAPLPDERSFVCVSNALASAPAPGAVSQIVRYDPDKSEFRALSDAILFYDSPRVSPDGERVVFASGAGGTDGKARIYEASPRNPLHRVMPFVTRLADGARGPIWLDDKTLLFENLAPQTRGLYWMPAAPPTNAGADESANAGAVAAARVIVAGGSEASIIDENGIVFSAKTSLTAPPQLFIVARDGSGLRALAATSNARRPAVSPDGQTLAYDAPLANGRALWVMPLLRVETRAAAIRNYPQLRNRARDCAGNAAESDEPSVQLSSVRAVDGGVAIVGSLRGAANSTITLEVGQGGKPRRWENLSVSLPPDAPPADAQGNRVLAIWTPPTRARGDWTLRLSLRGLGGGTQSVLRFRLPLPPASPSQVPLPPPFTPPNDAAKTDDTSGSHDAATAPIPRATPLPALPDVTPVRGPFLPLPSTSSVVPIPSDNGEDVPDFPEIQSPLPLPIGAIAPPQTTPAPPTAPLPTAPAPPAPAPLAKIPPANLSTTAGSPIVPIDPAHFQAPPTTPVAVNVPPPTVARDEGDESNYGDRPVAPDGTLYVAQFDVTGTPAHMAPREKIKVTLWGINRGTADWQTGASGADRVRLVARWVDFSTGTRRQWNFFWLPDSVAPGERTKMEFDVPAPARAGKYKLIYGLVRLPENGEYKAPAYSDSQETWPDEFGAIAFAVEVN